MLALMPSEHMAFTPYVYVDVYMASKPSECLYVCMAITPYELSCVDGVYVV